MTLGTRFKQLRLEKNLTQQELVNDFNNIYGYTFTKSAISQYENDNRKPEIEALIHFAIYFDVSLDYLFGLSERKEIIQPSNEIDIVSEFLSIGEKLFDNNELARKKKDMIFKKISNLYFKSLDVEK